MKGSNTWAFNAVVSEKEIHRKFLDLITESYPELFQNEGFSGLPEDLRDHFSLQSGLALRTEFNAQSLLLRRDKDGGREHSRWQPWKWVEDPLSCQKAMTQALRHGKSGLKGRLGDEKRQQSSSKPQTSRPTNPSA